jgi:hypothetical protein
MALRIEDVDRGAGIVHVRRAWDATAGEIPTKSGKDRKVPVAAVLRDYLDEHLLGLARAHANISITLDRYGHLMPVTRTKLQGCSTRT